MIDHIRSLLNRKRRTPRPQARRSLAIESLENRQMMDAALGQWIADVPDPAEKACCIAHLEVQASDSAVADAKSPATTPTSWPYVGPFYPSLLQQAADVSKPLLIVAEDIEGEALATASSNFEFVDATLRLDVTPRV